MAARLAKVVMVAALAAFALLVAADNVFDYGANFEFVRHVLSMDTTFHDPALTGRAIMASALWHAAYIAIIAAEGATGVLLAAGALALWRARRGPAQAFQHAKRWAIAGATLGFLVWFFGFMVVGGEWFAMWQSAVWNGQQGAFRFYTALLGVLIFVNQPDSDRMG